MNDLLRRLLFLPEQASSVARDIDGLHFFIIITTMVGWVTITLIGTILLVRFRRRYAEQPARAVRMPVSFEVAMIVVLLSLFLLWWFIGFRQYVRLRRPPNGAITIYVTAKQWMWKFAYPDGRSALGALTVPAGKPVRLMMISRDVIHSFYVPAFRIKQDVLPGRYTETWFKVERPGTYQLFCAEYCGLLHSNMMGTVVALSPDDYSKWIRRTEPAVGPGTAAAPVPQRELNAPPVIAANTTGGSAPALAEQGKAIAERYGCFNCHTTDGRPHIGPTWRELFDSRVPLKDGTTVLANEAYLTESMMDPRAKVVAGYIPVMPSYQGILPAGDVAALVELIKSIAGPPTEASVVPKLGGEPQ